MDTPFVFDKYVTGKNFIGRTTSCNILYNLLSSGDNATIYAPPKSGKMSLIQQTLFNMRMQGCEFVVGEFSVLNIRDIRTFLIRFGTTVIKTLASSSSEYGKIVSEDLNETHFRFDAVHYSETGEVIATNGEIDDNDIQTIMDLPYRMVIEKNQKMYLIINEFQNIDLTEDGDKVFKAMEKSIQSAEPSSQSSFSFIFCGSMVNAMKEIFEEKKYFYRMAEHVELAPFDEKDIIELASRGFLSNGKVIERELLQGMCKLFQNNMWYINHFLSICDYLSKGYIIMSTLSEALDILLSIHEPRFIAYVNDLTSFQLSLLRAILDGKDKFSTSEVIEEYGLNSSANVKRLKDALKKKEIVTFDEKENPTILDPLFEYWVKKYYFEKKTEL
jgi:hypothetical protein